MEEGTLKEKIEKLILNAWKDEKIQKEISEKGIFIEDEYARKILETTLFSLEKFLEELGIEMKDLRVRAEDIEMNIARRPVIEHWGKIKEGNYDNFTGRIVGSYVDIYPPHIALCIGTSSLLPQIMEKHYEEYKLNDDELKTINAIRDEIVEVAEKEIVKRHEEIKDKIIERMPIIRSYQIIKESIEGLASYIQWVINGIVPYEEREGYKGIVKEMFHEFLHNLPEDHSLKKLFHDDEHKKEGVAGDSLIAVPLYFPEIKISNIRNNDLLVVFCKNPKLCKSEHMWKDILFETQYDTVGSVWTKRGGSIIKVPSAMFIKDFIQRECVFEDIFEKLSDTAKLYLLFFAYVPQSYRTKLLQRGYIPSTEKEDLIQKIKNKVDEETYKAIYKFRESSLEDLIIGETAGALLQLLFQAYKCKEENILNDYEKFKKEVEERAPHINPFIYPIIKEYKKLREQGLDPKESIRTLIDYNFLSNLYEKIWKEIRK